MAQVPAEEAAAYAAMDAAVVLSLLPELKEELESHHGTQLYETIEMPLISVLADMEMAGIALDVNYLQRMSQELNARLSEIEQKVYQSVGEPFNLNSPQQLSEALFNRLKLDAAGSHRQDLNRLLFHLGGCIGSPARQA